MSTVCIICGTPCSGVQVGVYYRADFECCIYTVHAHNMDRCFVVRVKPSSLDHSRIRPPQGMALQLAAQTESNRVTFINFDD